MLKEFAMFFGELTVAQVSLFCEVLPMMCSVFAKACWIEAIVDAPERRLVRRSRAHALTRLNCKV